jgi:hypothetical protein
VYLCKVFILPRTHDGFNLLHACHLFLILRSKLFLIQKGAFPRRLQTRSSSLFFFERSYVRTSILLKSILLILLSNQHRQGTCYVIGCPSLHFSTSYLHRFGFFPCQGNVSEESAYHVTGGVLDPWNIHPWVDLPPVDRSALVEWI